MIKKENGVDEVKEWKKNIPPIHVPRCNLLRVLPLKMIVSVHIVHLAKNTCPLKTVLNNF